MTLVGAPDGQIQNAPTATILSTTAINALGGNQVITIGAGVLPYHAALQILWVAAFVSAGSPIQVDVQTTVNSNPVMDTTNLQDGATITVPLVGHFIVDGGTNQLQATVRPSPLGVNPVSGTVIVMAYTSLPTVIPAVRRRDIGKGVIAAGTAVGAGLTVTVLAAPATGTYWRIKGVLFRTNAAPAAGLLLSAQGASSLGLLAVHFTLAALTTFNDYMDVELFEGVSFSNPTAVNLTCAVIAERWQQ